MSSEPRRPLGWLPGVQEEDDFVYNIDELRAAGWDVRELKNVEYVCGWLVVQRDLPASPSGGLWLRFAVLRFHQSDDEGEKATCLFYGDGPGGAEGDSLRECRHTYWGEGGYIFYPDGTLIVAALKALSEFYDDMWESE